MAPVIHRRLIALMTLLTVALASVGSAAASDGVQLVEQKIKAGLVYNFLKYTHWPNASPQAAMVVCMLGGDPFDGQLAPMAGRTVSQRMIELRPVRDATDTAGCAVMTIRADHKSHWAAARKSLTGKGILTFADFDGFATEGGMVEFTRVDDRVSVKINTDAVAGAHLQIDDRLLKLATVVRTGVGQ
jgi:hypothetical protein